LQIPGVTLPLEHLGFYLIALLVSGVLHEAGHAIASFHERIPINHSGIFLYFVYPGAFVDIPSRPLSLLSPRRQLKVICAGVWHNFVLWLITALILSNGLKFGLQIFGWRSLEGSGGVSVVDVRSDSPLAEHLPISSVIYRLNDVYLENNIDDWNKMLVKNGVWSIPSNGFCVEADELEVAGRSIIKSGVK
jgi:S2P endopeptidase